MSDAIRFQAEIYKVQTLADGGLRLTLDLGEQDLKAAVDMMECKKRGALVEFAAVPLINNKETINAIQTRSKWKP